METHISFCHTLNKNGRGSVKSKLQGILLREISVRFPALGHEDISRDCHF